MNSGLSILLFRRPQRILKIFSTQIHTLQVVPINKMKTSNNNNITFFRKQQNMYYSTLNPNTTSPSDLIYLCYFLHECLNWKTSTYDLVVPVLDRITGSKSIETLISELQSIGLLNDYSSTNLLSLLAYAGKNQMLVDAYHHMVKSRGFVPNTFALNILVGSLFGDDDKIDVMPQVYQLLGLKVKLGIELSTIGWASIIHKCCELGRHRDATKFFFNMIQTDCSSSVVPVTHTVLFRAFLDSNNVDDALHLVNAMLSEGFEPDKNCFAKLVAALCADGRIDEAVSAYSDIVMKHPHSDVHLDNQIPIMIMTQLIYAGMNDKAEIVLTLSRSLRTEASCLLNEGNM